MATSSKNTSAAKAKAKTTAGTEDQGMPSEADIAILQQELGAYMADTRFERMRSTLQQLMVSPPQVLLIEGGLAEQRKATADYWALLLNCERLHPKQEATQQLGLGFAEVPCNVDNTTTAETVTPCLHCPTCIRFLAHQHRDLFFLDGAASSIKMDDVREVRSVLGEPPRESAYRVVIFHEAQIILEAAANSLLKSFEEPRKATTFMLLAPQRERLLPTLVSRSMCLTLPWPRQEDATLSPVARLWLGVLEEFLQTGKGLFAYSSVKGEVTPQVAQEIIELLRKSLAARIRFEQSGQAAARGVETLLQRVPFARLRMVDELLAEAQDSIIYTVNPALVVEWLVTRLFLLQAKA